MPELTQKGWQYVADKMHVPQVELGSTLVLIQCHSAKNWTKNSGRIILCTVSSRQQSVSSLPEEYCPDQHNSQKQLQLLRPEDQKLESKKGAFRTEWIVCPQQMDAPFRAFRITEIHLSERGDVQSEMSVWAKNGRLFR